MLLSVLLVVWILIHPYVVIVWQVAGPRRRARKWIEPAVQFIVADRSADDAVCFDFLTLESATHVAGTYTTL